MTRREFVATTATLSSLACVADPIAEAQTQAAVDNILDAKRPNILLIIADQHRFDCLGCSGNSEVRTPHIDALAQDGVRHTQCICPYPVCTPSRYSLITGRYVFEHRGYSNHCTLPPEFETFPRMLRDAGYETKAVGKMHYTPTYLDVGFQEMVLAEQNGPGRWDDDYHRELRAAGLVNASDLEDQESRFRKEARPEYWKTFGALPSNLPEEFHSTSWVGRKTLESLEDWGTGPQLLVASFVKPHHPFDPPANWASRYDAEKLSILPGWSDTVFDHDQRLNKGYFENASLTQESLRRVMAHYYAGIEHIDAQVGALVDALKQRGLYDDTVIVYTSDHGEYLGQHHLLLKGNYMYEALTRVPLIIKYPQQQRSGTVSNGLTNLVDLAPTLLQQARLAPAPGMKGLNLAERPDGRPIDFSEGHNGEQRMARTATHKLIVHDGTGDHQFYELDKDPWEMENRYADPGFQNQIHFMTQAMNAWRDPALRVQPHVDENAPVIDAPNVPPSDGAHRDLLQTWTTGQMKGIWERT
ncbi:MAG: sulfatase-like hydrolase/transferase [Candidatus Hydrogenedentes bacterium]|nr:sulfatase-like hydrolase/transferase [Candidatus Hydrogenedentota bacterium]